MENFFLCRWILAK